MNFIQGVMVAASLEFRQRIRAGRWRWLLVGWFAIIGLFTLLFLMGSANIDQRGGLMFGWLTIFVLGLLVFVSPSLSAQSINGDREHGTLATLQVTRLSAFEIALGKFLSAWLTGEVFLVLTIPMSLFCWALGGINWQSMLSVFITMSLTIGFVTAVSLALSSLLKRSTTSTVLSYMFVFGLTIGTLITFVLAATIVSSNSEGRDDSGGSWLILAVNPVVVVADASPAIVDRDQYNNVGGSPLLYEIRKSVRQLRGGGIYEQDTMTQGQGGAVWPFGIGIYAAIAVGSLYITTRRLRAPVGKIPRGQRVA